MYLPFHWCTEASRVSKHFVLGSTVMVKGSKLNKVRREQSLGLLFLLLNFNVRANKIAWASFFSYSSLFESHGYISHCYQCTEAEIVKLIGFPKEDAGAEKRVLFVPSPIFF